MSEFEDLFRSRIPLGEAASFFIGIKKFADPMNELPAQQSVGGETGDVLVKAAKVDSEQELKDKAVKSLRRGSRSALHSLSRKDLMERYQKGERAGDVAGRVLGGAAGLAGGAVGGGKNKAIAGALGAAVGQHMGGTVGRYVGGKRDIEKFRKSFKKKAEQLSTNESKAPGAGLGATSGIIEDTETASIEELEKQTPKKILRKSVGMTEKRAMFKTALEEMGVGASEPNTNSELDVKKVPVPVPVEPAAIEPGVDQHIKQELAGRVAEKTQEAEYYRQVAGQATQEAQTAQQSAQMANEQAMQAQQASEMAQQQVQQAQATAQQVGETAVASAATAHSIAAQAQQRQLASMNEAMMHRDMSAKMRTGVMNLKQQVMQAVQSDTSAGADPMLGAPPVGAPPAPPAMPVQPTPPMPPEGAMLPGDVPPEGAPPEGAVPPEGAPPTEAPPMPPPPEGAPPEPMKMAGTAGELIQQMRAMSPVVKHEVKRRAPYAAVGAALGAGSVLAGRGRHAVADTAEVGRLEGLKREGDTSFGTSMQLAKAKMRQAVNQVADDNPYHAAAVAAGMGAMTGATSGPQLAEALKRGRKLLKG